MNPIAVGLVAFGTLLLALGLLMLARNRKAIGLTLSFLGLGTAVAPFAITFFLSR